MGKIACIYTIKSCNISFINTSHTKSSEQLGGIKMINFDNIIQFLCPIKRGQANTLMLKSESISIDVDSYSISKSYDKTSDSKNIITSLQKKYLTINEVVNYIYGNKLFEIKESVNSNSYKQKYASFRNHSEKKGIMNLYPHFDSLIFGNTNYILTVLNNVQSLIEILAPEHCYFENLEDFFCQTFLMYNTDVTMINNWKSLISDAEILTIMFLSCAISPTKDTEERFFNHSFLTSIFPDIKKIFYSESLINEEINNYFSLLYDHFDKFRENEILISDEFIDFDFEKIDSNSKTNKNIALIGESQSGKSYILKILLLLQGHKFSNYNILNDQTISNLSNFFTFNILDKFPIYIDIEEILKNNSYTLNELSEKTLSELIYLEYKNFSLDRIISFFSSKEEVLYIIDNANLLTNAYIFSNQKGHFFITGRYFHKAIFNKLSRNYEFNFYRLKYNFQPKINNYIISSLYSYPQYMKVINDLTTHSFDILSIVDKIVTRFCFIPLNEIFSIDLVSFYILFGKILEDNLLDRENLNYNIEYIYESVCKEYNVDTNHDLINKIHNNYLASKMFINKSNLLYISNKEFRNNIWNYKIINIFICGYILSKKFTLNINNDNANAEKPKIIYLINKLPNYNLSLAVLYFVIKEHPSIFTLDDSIDVIVTLVSNIKNQLVLKQTSSEFKYDYNLVFMILDCYYHDDQNFLMKVSRIFTTPIENYPFDLLIYNKSSYNSLYEFLYILINKSKLFNNPIIVDLSNIGKSEVLSEFQESYITFIAYIIKYLSISQIIFLSLDRFNQEIIDIFTKNHLDSFEVFTYKEFFDDSYYSQNISKFMIISNKNSIILSNLNNYILL